MAIDDQESFQELASFSVEGGENKWVKNDISIIYLFSATIHTTQLNDSRRAATTQVNLLLDPLKV